MFKVRYVKTKPVVYLNSECCGFSVYLKDKGNSYHTCDNDYFNSCKKCFTVIATVTLKYL